MAGGLSAQDRTATALIERFERTGQATLIASELVGCGPEKPESERLLDGLLSREWPPDREWTLAMVLGVGNWDGCPDPRIDTWLISRFRTAALTGSIEYRHYWRALSNRRGPRFEEAAMDAATDERLPNEIRMSAITDLLVPRSLAERANSFFANLDRDELPSGYFEWEGSWLASRHPDELFSRLTPARVVDLLEPGVPYVITTLAEMVAGYHRAGPATFQRAPDLLRAVLELGSARYGDLIARRLEWGEALRR